MTAINEGTTENLTGTELGEEFATALGAKKFARIRQLLHNDIDFQALTPSRHWNPANADDLVANVLPRWFGEPHIDSTEVKTDRVGDTHRVSYRFAGKDDDSPFVVEQQAYYRTLDGQIKWMRVLCTGFRKP